MHWPKTKEEQNDILKNGSIPFGIGSTIVVIPYDPPGDGEIKALSYHIFLPFPISLATFIWHPTVSGVAVRIETDQDNVSPRCPRACPATALSLTHSLSSPDSTLRRTFVFLPSSVRLRPRPSARPPVSSPECSLWQHVVRANGRPASVCRI